LDRQVAFLLDPVIGLRRAFDPALGLALFSSILDDFFTRSGSLALPVSRFHSSNALGEISPLTSSSAD
jgi:hypothetical protein